MIFESSDITRLRALVKERMSEKRYRHTLGVEKLAIYLGEAILPDKLNELAVAALLHDVAKELSFDDHVELLRDSNVSYTEEDLTVKPALHAIAAVPLIQREFSEYATSDICSAVKNHTVGEPEMSLFDEIIFISDYAEEGRTYHTCIEVRDYLISNVKKGNSFEENVRHLHEASLKSINSTIESLTNRNERIKTKTLLTKRYIADKIRK